MCMSAELYNLFQYLEICPTPINCMVEPFSGQFSSRQRERRTGCGPPLSPASPAAPPSRPLSYVPRPPLVRWYWSVCGWSAQRCGVAGSITSPSKRYCCYTLLQSCIITITYHSYCHLPSFPRGKLWPGKSANTGRWQVLVRKSQRLRDKRKTSGGVRSEGKPWHFWRRDMKIRTMRIFHIFALRGRIKMLLSTKKWKLKKGLTTGRAMGESPQPWVVGRLPPPQPPPWWVNLHPPTRASHISGVRIFR